MDNRDRREAELNRQVLELQAKLAECRAEVAFRHDSRDEARRQQLGAIVEVSRDAIWSWTIDGAVTSWNAEAERLFQYTADEIIGQPLLKLVPAERLERARDAMSKLRDGGWYGQYETVRLRKDGTPVQVELTVSPIRDSAGAIVGAATVCRDITERKQSEAQQELLRRELDHRVKNTLATVYALMQQIARTSDSKEAFLAAFEERLHTLIRTHDALMEGQSSGAHLRTLIETELRAFCPQNSRAITLAGDDIVLHRQPAQMLCLAIHELAANAARHGALSADAGRIRITWALEQANPHIRLEWQEHGGPPIDAEPWRRGFGRSLLERGLAQALGGSAKLEFAPHGLRYELSFPVMNNIVSEGVGASGVAANPPPPARAEPDEWQ